MRSDFNEGRVSLQFFVGRRLYETSQCARLGARRHHSVVCIGHFAMEHRADSGCPRNHSQEVSLGGGGRIGTRVQFFFLGGEDDFVSSPLPAASFADGRSISQTIWDRVLFRSHNSPVGRCFGKSLRGKRLLESSCLKKTVLGTGTSDGLLL